MIYVVYATLTSVLMLVIVRLFDKLHAHTFYALLLNYLSAFICGLIHRKVFMSDSVIVMNFDAWALTAIEGFLFITVFYWIAQTIRYYGMAVASVSNKMSLIFPVISAAILFDERLNLLKCLGLSVALLSVYFVTYSSDNALMKEKYGKKLFFPLMVFLGSGLVDSLINYGNKKIVTSTSAQLIFSTFVYLFALFVGLIYLFFGPLDKNTRKRFYYQSYFSWKTTIVLGLLLGIPNFYNLYFIIQALNTKMLPSGQIFLVLNLSNVVFSALVGIFLFKEKLSWINWLGVIGASFAIVLMQ